MGKFSRRACNSWRFVIVSGHDGHDRPGACRDCWKACDNVLSRDQWAAGIRRCDECVQSLVHCPLVSVRRALVDEKNLPEAVLRVLMTDRNGPVSMKALRRLDEIAASRKQKAPATAENLYGAVDIPMDTTVLNRREFRQQTMQQQRTQQQMAVAARTSVWGVER